ncbi:MAG: glycosyltransferase family 2 protein, partial [Kiritimatiellae bacterium]|nr:glycosyltransferase family 2 protein [Kiritimatiellia bacterium]
MYDGRRVAVVMPAYNAAKTLRTSFDEVVAQRIADVVVIVDDCSVDETEKVANSIVHLQPSPLPSPKVIYHRHPRNRGYGG